MNIDDLYTLCKMIKKYVKWLSSLKAEKCLITPVIGVAPYIAKKNNMLFITREILIAFRRAYATDPYSINYLILDSGDWISKMIKIFNECFIDKRNMNVEFVVYYDPIDQWPLLLNYVPIIIVWKVDDILANTNCNEFHLTQFTGFKMFGSKLINNDLVETTIISPYKIDLDNIFEYNCTSPVCIDFSKNSDYSYKSEYEFLEKRVLKDIGKMKHIDKIFIEVWSSRIFLERDITNAYIWFYKPSQETITHLINRIENMRTKFLKISLPYPLFAELGVLNTDKPRLWLSHIIKSIVVNSKPKIEIIT
ncbi:hypothetical protein QPL79_02810 [Ignisphaera sp. 4213-co]|uniref:Uncharacterized protein n=1 Tax=Ignisphaera cupida TaxID=3050454 RepID=A0ABD4Z6Q2_9CREN|nr:hypothetical protein [Ignisphaera sp. 4213-co]MDK6028293.1 hypothetical protein [Ignisphaera sp. 4213-co]